VNGLSAAIISNFDLGGSFSSSLDVIAALRASESYRDAERSRDFEQRLQASYRYSHEPMILACEREEGFRLDGLPVNSSCEIELHPAGVVTFTHRIADGLESVRAASSLDDRFLSANSFRYRPYLLDATGSTRDVREGYSEGHIDQGLDLITPLQEIREIVRPKLATRPHLYPPIDARVIVCLETDYPFGAEVEDLVLEFIQGRSVASKPSFQRFRVRTTPVRAHEWRGVLMVSCDVDAIFVAADSAEKLDAAVDCIEAAHQMWFLCRAWVGILDAIGTVQIDDEDIDENVIRALERRVVDLSALEHRIASSMTEVETASVMVRGAWLAQAIDFALECFEVQTQRRLLDQRLMAIDRNHKTVAEILDRAHQKAARAQADRLQLLFAGAVAATLTALIPATASLHAPVLQVATFGLTGLVWVLFAIAVIRLGRFRIRIGGAEDHSSASREV
jgi:hypothetical protein